MNYKEKAEKYVREKLPELMELSFGCLLKAHYEEAVLVTSENQYQTRTFLSLTHNRTYKFEKNEFKERFEIIGHPIRLNDWLRVVGEHCGVTKVGIDAYGDMVIRPRYENRHESDKIIRFNLTTGQPATEADYQAFCQIVGVE